MAKWTCKHCGSEFIARVVDVKKGYTKSCGCLKKERFKEYAKENNRKNNRERTKKRIFDGDKKFGMLTPISFADDYISPNGNSVSRILCKCDCGKEAVVRASNLLNGDTTSCGCYNKQMVSERSREITRKKVFEHGKFGMLMPISFADDYVSPNGTHASQILCKCDCGNETVVNAASLLSGKTTSCSCRTTSKASQNINDVLSVLHIPFAKELRIPGCFNPETGVLLPFDFAILDENKKIKALIEYQGEQHYKDAGDFGRLEREVTDKIKKDFCTENGITLYEIRFDEDETEALKRILKEIL